MTRLCIALIPLLTLPVTLFPQVATLRAPLVPIARRTPAPAFSLTDELGQTATLKQFRGKVVLLDFWATWCGGCKEEIPQFAAFQERYGRNRFAVVGVSVDEGGWDVLRPFLAEHPIAYTNLLGTDATMDLYGLKSLPDTFLIDPKGRIAAAYKGTLVNMRSVDSNIQSLLRERAKK